MQVLLVAWRPFWGHRSFEKRCESIEAHDISEEERILDEDEGIAVDIEGRLED